MSWQVEQFQHGLQKALERAKIVLAQARSPCFAADVHHQYQDKYILAETMTNAALASHANSFALLGLDREQLKKMCSWAEKSAVSLRFKSEESCKFLREETREVEDPTKHVLERTVGAVQSTFTSKTVQKVTEYFWEFSVTYELMAVRGVGANPDEDIISIQKRAGQIELKTSGKAAPHPEKRFPVDSAEVNVSWLIKYLQAESDPVVPNFTIDRKPDKCHTPRRNPEVDAGVHALSDLGAFARTVERYMGQLLRCVPHDSKAKLDANAVNNYIPFVPVLPCLVDTEQQALTDQSASAAAGESSAPTGLMACLAGAVDDCGNNLGSMDINGLLSEERRLLQEKREDLKEAFPESAQVATVKEAELQLITRHCREVCDAWTRAIDYIEGMLRKQLIAAIGKEVMPWDFADYMTFHNRKLFAAAYLPKPFCYAVRRSPEHSPEGTVSIEQTSYGGESTMAAPIVTTSAYTSGEHPMQFPLSASTNVTFGGDKYLHAWLSHQFSGTSGSTLSLVSRTRQFSSMIVLVGRISSAKTFDPKYAAILRNKDELKIPLDLSTIPTPKEFKDAIESLSPQQQAFAKAFRSMQLESTLFGILVIQIKPQLEKVLQLPHDSLTKEIKLTQELMELFITYQIPSDLLSFDENSNINQEEGTTTAGGPAGKLAAVKRHVAGMQEMINASKQEEIQGRRMEESYAHPSHYLQRASSDASEMSLMSDCAFECAAVNSIDDEMFMEKSVLRSSSMMMKKSAGSALNKAKGMMERAKGVASAVADAPRSLSRAMSGDMMKAEIELECDGGDTLSIGGGDDAKQADGNATDTGSPQHANNKHEHGEEEEACRDYTKVPKQIDAELERLDVDGQVRPTVINPSGPWEKRSQKALLASPVSSFLYDDEQKKEKDAAFDLLDALTKSGAIPVEHASLHVVIAATHCFDKSVLETVVQDSVNPIDKVERSTLIMASTVHGKPTNELLRHDQLNRVKAASPTLFEALEG